MAAIRKRGEKWQVQVRRLGQRSVSRTFTRLKDAQEWARNSEVAADRQELGGNRSELKKLTLRELVHRYRHEVVAKKKSAQVETIVLDAFARHPICNKTLSALKMADFVRYRDERLEEVAAATVRRQLNPIRHMFNVAIDEWGLPLAENPLAKVKVKGADQRRERRLKPGEFDRLMRVAVACQTPHLAAIIEFAVETGMRRGEILAMRWEHLQLDKGLLLIPETKTGHPRTIPLTAKAKWLLSARLAASGRVFPLSANALRLAWERVTRKAGIEDLHFHDLRHEAISRFFEMGLTMPEVGSISGHRDARMLLRYAHAKVEELAAKLGA